ncbi:MAG: hypothetical protein IJV00_03070 [Clostridia bacterium]|nr:hypothetical protein [Clostridia bacterium]
MTVIIYIAVFFAIVAAVGVGGALCESERFEKKCGETGKRVSAFFERALGVVLLPVDAAFAIYEAIKQR